MSPPVITPPLPFGCDYRPCAGHRQRRNRGTSLAQDRRRPQSRAAFAFESADGSRKVWAEKRGQGLTMRGVAGQIRLIAALAVVAAVFAPVSGLAETTLHFIPQADLRSL